LFFSFFLNKEKNKLGGMMVLFPDELGVTLDNRFFLSIHSLIT